MIANYHTHTWRCHHAIGSERAYVEQAIAAGVQILGFADHTPYLFSNGYVSDFRMLPGDADGYFTTLTDLKREYAGDIEIHIGLEAEYYPAYFDALLRFLADYPCEYLLLGQHHIYNEYDGPYSGSRTWDEAVLTQYVTQTLEGLATGKFTYLAHPDLLHWRGDEQIYRREMTRLCQGVKALDYPLEVNLLGLYGNRWYPRNTFWEIAAETGNTAILGLDAHQPDSFTWREAEEDGRGLVKHYGLPLLETVELRPL